MKAILAAMAASALAAFAAVSALTVPAAANVNIVDGDTATIDGVTIRLVEIDTPETFRSRCEHELVLGLAAKARLRKFSMPARSPMSGPASIVTDGRSHGYLPAASTLASGFSLRGMRSATSPAPRPSSPDCGLGADQKRNSAIGGEANGTKS